jgi:hypothetical protein
MNFRTYLILESVVTPADLKAIQIYIDKFFKSLNIDIQFTRHFLQRVNDRGITVDELRRLFGKAFKQHGNKISRLPDGTQAVIRDMVTNVNMPFVFEWDITNKRFDLVPKSIMKKRGFMTHNKTFDIKGEYLP